MSRKRLQDGSRSGFLTLGMILCLILILTTAAVLWSFQFLTIQNQELYYAGRASVQGAMAGQDASSWNVAAATTTVDRLFTANTAPLKRTGTRMVEVTGTANRTVFTFRETRQLPFFSGIFSQAQRDIVEKDGNDPAYITHTFYVTNDGTTLRLSHKEP